MADVGRRDQAEEVRGFHKAHAEHGFGTIDMIGWTDGHASERRDEGTGDDCNSESVQRLPTHLKPFDTRNKGGASMSRSRSAGLVCWKYIVESRSCSASQQSTIIEYLSQTPKIPKSPKQTVSL